LGTAPIAGRSLYSINGGDASGCASCQGNYEL